MSLDHSSESRLLTARSRADGPEAVAVAAGEHRRHVAAVAAAEHADPVAVAERVAVERGVEHGEHVVDVDRAPAGAGRPSGASGPMIAWPHAVCRPLPPRGLRHHDDEAGGGLHLRLVEERLAVLRERPAVDVEQHRVRASTRRSPPGA